MGRKADLKCLLRESKKSATASRKFAGGLHPSGIARLAVRTLGGDLCSVNVGAADTARDVKYAIKRSAGISIYEQRLVFRQRELTDRDTLSLVGLPLDTGSGITLLRRNPSQAWWLRMVDLGITLFNAPPEIKADREVVLQAVRLDGRQLLNASPELQKDRDLALIAAQSYPQVFYQLGEEMRSDKELALAAIRKNGYSIRSAAGNLRSDRGLFLAALTWSRTPAILSQCPCCGIPLPDRLCADREFMLQAVLRGRADVLDSAIPEIQQDADFALVAIKKGALDAYELRRDSLRSYRSLQAELREQGFRVWSSSATFVSAAMEHLLRQSLPDEVAGCEVTRRFARERHTRRTAAAYRRRSVARRQRSVEVEQCAAGAAVVRTARQDHGRRACPARATKRLHSTTAEDWVLRR